MYDIVKKLGKLKLLDARIVVQFEDAMDYLVNLGVIDALRCLENTPNTNQKNSRNGNVRPQQNLNMKSTSDTKTNRSNYVPKHKQYIARNKPT